MTPFTPCFPFSFLRRLIGSHHAFRVLVILGICAIPLEADIFSFSFPGATDAERALESPKIDPEAEAEYLARSIRIDDRSGRRWVNYYARLKIFTEAGVEEYLNFEVESWDGYSISRVKARVTFPDGSFTDMAEDSIYRREIWQENGEQIWLTSVPLSGLRRGSIVEIHYEAAVDDFDELWVFAHESVPTHHLHVRLDPVQGGNGRISFAGISRESITRGGDWTEFDLYDLPASKDEIFAPPNSSIMPWILVYYVPIYLVGDVSQDFWETIAKALYKYERDVIDYRSRPIREKAEALTSGAQDDAERLRRLYEFCIQEISDVHSDRAGLSDREIEALEMPNDPEETLKLGHGTAHDRLLLFASLAHALNFEVHLSLCNDRSTVKFTPELANLAALPDFLATVRRSEEDSWQFFDLHTPHLPFGFLSWRNSGTVALLANRRGRVSFLSTPAHLAPQNVRQRLGHFKIGEDGTLRGAARFKLTGQLALHWRNRLDRKTPEEQEEAFRDYLAGQLSNFILTGFKVTHLFNLNEPLQFDFRLELPDYALLTNSRLFVSPAVFETDGQSLFDEPTRSHDVEFRFPWIVRDRIQIDYPETLVWARDEIENGLGELDGISHQLQYWHNDEDRRFTFQRELKVELNGFRAEFYPTIKALFDQINERDRFPLTLQAVAPESPNSTPVID
jgi:hypothetical protein